MPATLEPTSTEDLPPPSVELDALVLMVEAYIALEGPVKGQAFLVAASRILERRERVDAVVVEFGPTREAAARAKVRRQTKAWFRKSLPRWLEALSAQVEPPKPIRRRAPRQGTRQPERT